MKENALLLHVIGPHDKDGQFTEQLRVDPVLERTNFIKFLLFNLNIVYMFRIHAGVFIHFLTDYLYFLLI